MVIVRDAELPDLEGIRRVFSENWKDEHGETQQEEVDYWTTQVKESIEKIGKGFEEQHKYFVALSDNEICGVAGLRSKIHNKLKPFIKTTKPVEFYSLFIKPDFQGIGIGRLLMKKMESAAKNMDFTEIIFVSASRWKDSWPFHFKMGFEKISTLRWPSGEIAVFRKII